MLMWNWRITLLIMYGLMLDVLPLQIAGLHIISGQRNLIAIILEEEVGHFGRHEGRARGGWGVKGPR